MKLRILTGPRRNEEIALPPEGRLSIGRGEGCDLTVEDRKMSREHCVVEWSGDSWTVRDGGSANGTWVEGDKVAERQVLGGETMTVGDTAIEFLAEEHDEPSVVPVLSGVDPTYDEAEEAEKRRRIRRASRGNGPQIAVLLALGAIGGIAYLYFRDPGDENEAARKTRTATKTARTERAAKTSSTGGSRPRTEDELASSKGSSGTDVSDDPVERDDGEQETKKTWKRPPGVEERIRELVDSSIPELLEKKEFRRALSLIAYHRRVTAGFDEIAAEQKQRVHGAAQQFVKETKAILDRLAEEEKPDEARELVFDRVLVLPSLEADDLHAALDRFQTRTERVEAAERDQQELELDARSAAFRALAALDFEKARRSVSDARLTAAKQNLSQHAIDALERDVRIAEAAWNGLLKALRSRQKSRTRVSFTFAESRKIVERRKSGGLYVTDTGGSALITAIEGPLIDAERGDGARILCDVLALDDAWILREAKKNAEGLENTDCAEGLAVLLLLREGPVRLKSFLAGSGLAEAIEIRLTELARARRDLWIIERRRQLGVARNYLETDPKATADQWLRQAARRAELAVLWKSLPGYKQHEGELENRFRDARIQHLRRSPPRRAFQAKKLELVKEVLTLTYDFSDDKQVKDFHVVGGDSRVGRKGGDLLLTGECRLFDGNPFIGRLSVKMKLPSGGFDGARPNLAVALWTIEGSPVTARKSMSLSTSMRGEKVPLADFFVFAYGYYAAPYDFGGDLLYQVQPPGNKDFVNLPANVVFLGRYGSPLHSFPSECLWAGPYKKRAGGSLQIHVEAGPFGAKWTAGSGRTTSTSGRRPIFERIPAAVKDYLERRERVGSISLLTNGASVRISTLEIEGQLDPLWLQSTFHTAIRNELLRLFE